MNKKKVFFCLILSIFCSIHIVFAQITPKQAIISSPHIISIKDPMWQDLFFITMEVGITPPSFSGPWTIDELSMTLQTIDPDSLSTQGQLRYNRILQTMHKYTQDLTHYSMKKGFSFSIAAETYMHANTNDFTLESDWIWDLYRRSPMVYLEAWGSIGPSWHIFSNFEIKKNRFARPAMSTVENPQRIPQEEHIFSPQYSSNIVTMGLHDFDTPSRAYISYGGKGYSLQIGRDLISWGPGHTGNLIIGDHHKYHEFIRGTLYTPSWKFTSAFLFFDPPLWTSRSRRPYVPDSPEDPTVRMFLAHRLEFSPTNWLRIELSENVMYQDNTFNIKYLNPAFIYHNLSNRGLFNAIADISVSATVTPNLLLYGVVAIDQIVAPGEGADQPNALGYMAGFRKCIQTEKGTWDLGLEFVLTDPYLYLRDRVDFIIMSREREQHYGFVPHYAYLGYKHGGDAFVANFKGSWIGIEKTSFGCEFGLVIQGAIDRETEFIVGEMPIIHAPSSPTTSTYHGGIWINRSFSFNKAVTIDAWGRGDVVFVKPEGNKLVHDIQLVGGIRLSL